MASQCWRRWISNCCGTMTVVAAILVLLLSALEHANAQTPRPSPSPRPSPTPTPSPTPGASPSPSPTPRPRPSPSPSPSPIPPSVPQTTTLGYTPGGRVVYNNTNTLTFTNALAFSSDSASETLNNLSGGYGVTTNVVLVLATNTNYVIISNGLITYWSDTYTVAAPSPTPRPRPSPSPTP